MRSLLHLDRRYRRLAVPLLLLACSLVLLAWSLVPLGAAPQGAVGTTQSQAAAADTTKPTSPVLSATPGSGRSR